MLYAFALCLLLFTCNKALLRLHIFVFEPEQPEVAYDFASPYVFGWLLFCIDIILLNQ
jgi:hypothetical protein